MRIAKQMPETGDGAVRERYSPKPVKGLRHVRVSDWAIALAIGLLCLTCILPFLHVAAKSVSSNTAVMAKEVYLWPKGWTFDAYRSIFRDGQLTHSMRYTVLVTALFTLVGMVLTICAAYPLSRRRLRGRVFFSLLMMFTLYFSAGLIPEYLLMKQLGILNTMWALVLPLAFSPYNMLIMKSYLQSAIPDSLEEAAFLDGASNLTILLRVVLPLSKPILATLSLFYAVGRWNAYADAKYYITRKALQPIQYLLSNMVFSSSMETISLSESAMVTSTPEVLQAATIMFATLPILMVYPFVQRYFVKGVMIGAVKG
ncbi:MAG TPA: carbohydrate ABC transporter permease [Clostridia bacterium]|nr:carbohydrate ABC transporter permease [Clostridia bacterium]